MAGTGQHPACSRLIIDKNRQSKSEGLRLGPSVKSQILNRNKMNQLPIASSTFNEPDPLERLLRNQAYKAWQKKLYDAYESKDYETAASIYTSKYEFTARIPDVHAAYRSQKEKDARANLVGMAGFIIYIVLLYFLFR